MSLHFLVDGYNVIKQVGALKSIHSLKEARDALIRDIRARWLSGNRGNRVTVVFDGSKECEFPCAEKSKASLHIIFSKGESADEVIKRMVQHSLKPSQIIVVSADKGIVYFTNSLGAKAMSPAEFLCEDKKLQHKQKSSNMRTEFLKAELSYRQQEEINQELRRIWQ